MLRPTSKATKSSGYCSTPLHFKMAKKKSFGSKKKDATETRVAEEDLDRFAGSSDDESGNDKSDNEREPDDGDAVTQNRNIDVDNGIEAENEHSDGNDDHSSGEQKADSSPSDNDDSLDDSDDDEEKDLHSSRTTGMANAMARILGAPTKVPGTQSVVLSKTKTPLQKLAEKEKQQEKELREKRRLNRGKHLHALHVPLSVATTAYIQKNSASKAISRELEEERAFRRIATRGVVALFNAISQHQKKPSDASNDDTGGNDSKDGKVKKMTKHSFLDMIKAKASSDTNAMKSSEPAGTSKSAQQEKGKQWNALKDDFMLNPKRNWDQESSDEEDDNESVRERTSKQQRVADT